jgi:hypothetical protein
MTWREVAELLAARLVYQAHCPEETVDGALRHLIPEDFPDCPFCCDRAAYNVYLKKAHRHAGAAVAVGQPKKGVSP